MGRYVELGALRTWFDEFGAGDALALLHPGGADARAWPATAPSLAEHFHVFTPEAIDADAEPSEALRRGYEQLSPDGAEHYPVVHQKLARMNFTEPTLTERELTTVPTRTLVMVADDVLVDEPVTPLAPVRRRPGR